MRILLIAVLLCAVPGLRFSGKGWQKESLSRQNTLAVNGIFVLVILISHASHSYSMPWLWEHYREQVLLFDQLVVVPFLFFSGYGVGMSLKTKERYIQTFPKKRILRLWRRYLFADGMMILLALACASPLSGQDALLSLFGLRTPLAGRLGNCGWYVCMILVLYGMTWIAHSLFRGSMTAGNLFTGILCTELVVLLWFLGVPSFWWNTLLLYPCGLWYSQIQERWEAVFKKSNILYFVLLFASAVPIYFLNNQYIRTAGEYWFFLCAALLMLAILLLLCKVRIGSRFLTFCGSHAFAVYILQAIPFFLLEVSEKRLNPWIYQAIPALRFLWENENRLNPYVYALLGMGMSLALAAVFQKICDKGEHWLCQRKKQIPQSEQTAQAEEQRRACSAPTR